MDPHLRLEGGPLLIRYPETRYMISCDSPGRESHRTGETLDLGALQIQTLAVGGAWKLLCEFRFILRGPLGLE